MVDLAKINKSVKHFEKVVVQMSSQEAGSDQASIPFNESKLTKMLADNLRANTLLIATLNILSDDEEEVVATLKFIDKARNNIQHDLDRNKKKPQNVQTVKHA